MSWFIGIKKMKFKICISRTVILCGLILSCLTISWHNVKAMHFDKPDLTDLTSHITGEEAEDMQQAMKASRVIDYTKNYPLHAAVMRGALEDISERIANLEDPSDIDIFDDEGKSPLYVAAFYRNIKAIDLLMENGANSEKVLKHPKSKFLQMNSHKDVNNLLRGVKRTTSELVIPKNTSNDMENKKKPIVISERSIKKILAFIAHDKEKGIAIFTGLINKFIIHNDVNNLTKLLRFKINEERLEYIQLSLRNGDILADAIHYAPNNDCRIVELLLSEMDLRFISEECLIKAYLVAKMKNDRHFLNAISGYIRTYFPNSFVIERCKAFKCGEEIRAIAYHEFDPYLRRQIEEEAEKKKMQVKYRNLAQICTLGLVLVGFIGYQLLKNDRIHTTTVIT